MQKILLSFIGVMIGVILYAQEPFQLLVEPGKTVLAGDGEDFTTLVITARNSLGEIIPAMAGQVKVGISSGFTDETEVKMESGVAMVKYTSPMFGTPIKSSQRMVYFTFRFMQKFMARATGSDDYNENQKLATGIALETMREGLNPITLIPQKKGDNFVYIVCELNGVRGKAKIEITKAEDGRNGNIIPGVYYGKDITGQSDWMLDITRGGEGTLGEASEGEPVGIMFSNEDFTDFNDAMGKMAGMTGFKKAFIGLPFSEQKHYENYDIRRMGMPSAYMVMPNHGVFTYIPPILFEYAGQRSKEDSPARSEEMVKTEKTGIVFTQNKIVGDGRSRTKAVFHFEDENGKPVAGKEVTWSIPEGIKVISKENVTDANGNAVVELEAPLLKAGEEKRGENTGSIIDNHNLYFIKASYASLSNKTETTQATLLIYKTIEQDIYILKPGMELSPYKVLLPQLEYYNLVSSIYSLLPESFMSVTKKKTPVNDAIVFLASRNFDKEEFQKLYDSYYKKDRDLFMMFLDNEKGGFSAITDPSGKFKLVVRDFEGKKRLYTGDYDRIMHIEPLEAKMADLTKRREGALTEVLGLLSAGSSSPGESGVDGGSPAEQSGAPKDYKESIYKQLLEMERELCTGEHLQAVYLEEKLHIIGLLMTNAKGTARFMEDISNEIIEKGWELLKATWEFANEKYKLTEKLNKKIGLDKVTDSLAKIGLKIELASWSYILGKDQKHGTKRIIVEQIKKYVLSSDAPNKNKASTAYYRMMGQAADAVSGKIWEYLTEGIGESLSNLNPVPRTIKTGLRNWFYAGLRVEVDKFMAQPPENVHAVFPQLREELLDHSKEIRAYYQDIAASRLDLELYKADFDLIRDVLIKGAVIVYDVKTMNWANVKKHLEYLDKFNKITDAAYNSTLFVSDLWRYKNLWQEAYGVFHFANMSISQGVIVSEVPAKEWNFKLFPEAYAAKETPGSSSWAVSGIASSDLSLKGGELPIQNLNTVISSVNSHTEWMESQSDKLMLLNGLEPEVAGKLYKSTSDIDQELTQLIVGALAYAQNRSEENRKGYESSAAALASGGAALAGIEHVTLSALANMPESFPVPVKEMETPVEYIPPGKIPYWVFAAAGALVLLLLILIILLVRRKKRRSVKLAQMAPPAAVIPSVVSAPPPAPHPQPAAQRPVQQPPASTPKFCAKCGNPLKPGTKFCSKCGNPV